MTDVDGISIALTGEKLDLSEKDIERLRRLWDEGKASGAGKPFDIERTIAAARARTDA